LYYTISNTGNGGDNMLREDNSCIVCKTQHDSAFDANSYLNEACNIFGVIDKADTFIRSGICIPFKAKDLVLSLELLGSKTIKEGLARFEVLLVKTAIDDISANDIETCMDLMFRHILKNGVDAVLVAIVSPYSNHWNSYFIRSPRFCYFEIPADIINYMCSSAIRNHLSRTCGLNNGALDKYFSSNDIIDDSVIQAKAPVIDSALRDIKCCDTSIGNGQLIGATANFVASLREKLNRYLGYKQERTFEAFLNHFIADSVYATDCDNGALETLKAEIRLNLPGVSIISSHYVWGNILVEDLFNKQYFDIIITNPPHMKQNYFFAIKELLSGYKADRQNADLCCYFAERTIDMLCNNGTAVILMSNRWMRSGYGSGLREFLSDKNITEIVDYGDIPVLGGITVPMSIITVSNSPADGAVNAVILDDPKADNISIAAKNSHNNVILPGKNKWIFTADKTAVLISKIKGTGITLEEYANGAVFRGLLTGLNEAFVINSTLAKKIMEKSPKCSEILKPFLSGRNVKRYAHPSVKKYLICMPKGFTKDKYIGIDQWGWLEQTYAAVAEHLKQFEEKATKRKDKGDFWWELRSFKHYDKMSQAKIICPTIVNRISATLDTCGLFSNDKTSVIANDDYYLLGVLNSTLMDFYFRHTSSSTLLNGYYELKPADLSALPIIKISGTNSHNVKLRDTIGNNAKKLMQLNALPIDTRTDDVYEDIKQAEREINTAVCHLYKLTHSETETVENL